MVDQATEFSAAESLFLFLLLLLSMPNEIGVARKKPGWQHPIIRSSSCLIMKNHRWQNRINVSVCVLGIAWQILRHFCLRCCMFKCCLTYFALNTNKKRKLLLAGLAATSPSLYSKWTWTSEHVLFRLCLIFSTWPECYPNANAFRIAFKLVVTLSSRRHCRNIDIKE